MGPLCVPAPRSGLEAPQSLVTLPARRVVGSFMLGFLLPKTGMIKLLLSPKYLAGPTSTLLIAGQAFGRAAAAAS